MSYNDNTSFRLFQSFISWKSDGTVNVERLISKECYESWLKTRLKPPKSPEESFRKALTAHCRGVAGRKPFPRAVEKALLLELRKKRIWDCFQGTEHKIGKRGYQALGYWEKQDMKADESSQGEEVLMTQEKNKKRSRSSDSFFQEIDLMQTASPPKRAQSFAIKSSRNHAVAFAPELSETRQNKIRRFSCSSLMLDETFINEMLEPEQQPENSDPSDLIDTLLHEFLLDCETISEPPPRNYENLSYLEPTWSYYSA